jgi:hypothetical protein
VSQTQHADSALASIGTLAAKASPPLGVLAGAAAGVDWQKWVWVVTFFYIALQALLLIWDRLIKPHMPRKRP